MLAENFFYVTSMSGRTADAEVTVTVEPVPGPAWTCGDVGYAFERYTGDTVTACTHATSSLAGDPVSVIAFAGEAVPGVAATAPWDGRCLDRRLLRDGQCAWAEEIQLLFWHERLFGISYYPFGHFDAPNDLRADRAAVAAALDQRFGTGRDTDTAHDGCGIPSGVPAGFIRRCRHWENSQTAVELFANAFGGDLDHVVHYQSRTIRSEIDAAVRSGQEAAAAEAAARDEAAAEAVGRRL